MTAKRVGDGSEAKRILTLVRRLVRALRIYDRQAQSRYGLTAAQMFVLHALAGVGEDGISLNDLADRIATDQSSASVVVQRLVAEGLVSRTPRPDDRRHVELRLTPQGRRTIRRAPPPAQEKMINAIDSMPPGDRKRLVALMETFVSRLGVSEKAPMLFEDEPRRARK